MNARARRQAGFSLLELTITLVLFSILAGTLQLSSTRRLADDVDRARTERAAEDVYRLANAAQHHAIRTGEWPNEPLLCDSAYSVLDAANLLKGAPSVSPYRNSKGEPTAYGLTCDANHFTITATAEDAGQAADLALKIPGATASGVTVTAHYPKSASSGVSGEFMPLDGSELPTGTWNFGNQFMFGVRDVVTSTGQTLLNSVQFATTVASGSTVQKPTCPEGMKPQIFTSLNRVSTPSGKPLHGIQIPVDDLGESWQVRAVITGSGGSETASPDTATITAFVKCSY